MIYLDHAATTEVRPETRAAMAPFLDNVFGNPSGVHEVSRRARNALEDARELAAELLGVAHPLDIVFTGGGTESDNMAVVGAALGGGKRRGVVTTTVEHEAVLRSAKFVERLGCPVAQVPVDRRGRIDPETIADAVDGETAVVSVMTANNETGTLFPVAGVAAAARSVSDSVLIHTDAVQAFVTEEVTVSGLGADMVTLAAHKFGGPKGVGLLVCPRRIDLEPVVHGGGQEMGRRSGTHNVAGIVGMVAAMQATVEQRSETRARVATIRHEFEAQLAAEIPGVEFNGDLDHRLVQHSHFRVPGVAAETLLIRLDQSGVAAAAGSACQSGAVAVSHVLAAMGMGEREAAECVRISFGWSSRPHDGSEAARLVAKAVGALR